MPYVFCKRRHTVCVRSLARPLLNQYNTCIRYLQKWEVPLVYDTKGMKPEVQCRVLVRLHKEKSNTCSVKKICRYLHTYAVQMPAKARAFTPTRIHLRFLTQRIRNSWTTVEEYKSTKKRPWIRILAL